MLSLPSTVRIYVCTQPADMRRAFDGLAAMTQQVIGQNPLSGHLFVFVNRRRDRLKILYWDRDGYALWAKRLERGTFRFPEPKGNSLEVTPSELAAILGGIDLRNARRQRRFALPTAAAARRGMGRVDLGGRPPRSPTDPDVHVKCIRFVTLWNRCPSHDWVVSR
jgi:transposase